MPRRARGAPGGFTLLEVMIVIVIILAIVGLVSVNLFSARDTAKINLTSIQLKAMRDALKQFNLTFDRYPSQDEGLSVLWSKENLSQDSDQGKWRMFMEEAKPKDPWNHEWGYRAESDSGHEFDLWSYGPDGEDGTDDDISVWGKADSQDQGFGPGDVGGSSSGGATAPSTDRSSGP